MKATKKIAKPEFMKPATKQLQCTCQSYEFEPLGELPTTDFHGWTPEGERYTSIVRQRYQCQECNKVTVVISFPFDASLWKE